MGLTLTTDEVIVFIDTDEAAIRGHFLAQGHPAERCGDQLGNQGQAGAQVDRAHQIPNSP